MRCVAAIYTNCADGSFALKLVLNPDGTASIQNNVTDPRIPAGKIADNADGKQAAARQFHGVLFVLPQPRFRRAGCGRQ